MDEIVARAMQKWPDVPDVYGWLRLDRRGAWWIRSAAARGGAPAFERIGNPAVVAFIGRNYAHDERGRWFFQNGPQRVFVRTDYTPLVYRLEAGGLVAHTGAAARELRGAWLDEHGALLLATELGPGVLTDRDLADVAGAFTDAAGARVDDDPLAHVRRGDLRLVLAGASVAVGTVQSAEVARTFGFDAVPAPPPGQPDC